MINIDIIPFALLLDRLIIKETVRKASLHLHQNGLIRNVTSNEAEGNSPKHLWELLVH